ncbi:MAG TPA: 1-(5-phosphoribosyl)-5-[(5-phosphoribosylamino)methylideneamino] imidazole-4-carboxamide isomerase [Thermoanaerobaculia bacterium]|jgi:phosphoribosylformimino-5-aminoimidazole carboxamide ribotide isomerase|nr:1-(5-phosphoribosyl)-5-[(5-phosphoribosylamino)methylideneamino] imidazole-4-carboxamide isomerase [Thermoanaerobaculia bacterium]
MELLPAIDLRGGQAVRLRQGDDSRRTKVGNDPVALLDKFAAAGVALVHVVDLDAALGEAPQCVLIERMMNRGVSIQLGGGLRDRSTIEAALALGAERAVVGSLVARDPDLFAKIAASYPGRLVPALDLSGQSGEVRISGWREGAARSLAELAAALIGCPCPAVLVTDVDRDGMMGGPNLALARRVARACGLPALLSGGISSLEDLAAARVYPEIAGAVVGQALYSGAFTLEEALAVAHGEPFA